VAPAELKEHLRAWSAAHTAREARGGTSS
jgi:hypothetical protein